MHAHATLSGTLSRAALLLELLAVKVIHLIEESRLRVQQQQ
jgi:hypothetical protein